jgi:hypothetical protein
MVKTMRTESSMDWVRRAGDYRVLVGKRDRLGYTLADAERARLDELERFFVQDANRRRAPWASREQIRAPISVVVQFGDWVGQARDISGDGMYIETQAPLAIGQRTVIRVTGGTVRDPDGDKLEGLDEVEAEAPYEQWEFGAEVVRLDGSGMGLRFVGIPLALRITHRHRDDDAPAPAHQHAA